MCLADLICLWVGRVVIACGGIALAVGICTIWMDVAWRRLRTSVEFASVLRDYYARKRGKGVANR